jgi:flagellar motor switch protein FliN/FliY
VDHVRYADVPLEVQAELDRKALTVREIMQLEVGGVIRMTRSAGENVDIVVGGALVAYGEIVIIEEALGVRITDFNGEGF